MQIQTILALYGAFVSTALAALTVLKFIKERPRITVIAELISTPSSGSEKTHGVLVQVKHGHDVLLEEADVEIKIWNAGYQPCQITDVFVETANGIQKVRPVALPVVLAPNTSSTVLVQPEIFVPKRLSFDNQLEDEPVLAVGVYDGIGNKHRISKRNLVALQATCKDLPLRTGVFRHKESGNLVVAVQVHDPARIVRKKQKK